MVITQCAQCIARLLGLMVYLPIYYLSTYQTFCCTEGRCFKKHTIFGWLYILIFDSRNRVRTITRKFLSIFLVKKILSKLRFRDPFQQFILCWYILMMESGNIQKHYEYIMKFRALFSAEFPCQARISINRVHPNIVHTLLQYIFHSSGCLFFCLAQFPKIKLYAIPHQWILCQLVLERKTMYQWEDLRQEKLFKL